MTFHSLWGSSLTYRIQAFNVISFGAEVAQCGPNDSGCCCGWFVQGAGEATDHGLLAKKGCSLNRGEWVNEMDKQRSWETHNLNKYVCICYRLGNHTWVFAGSEWVGWGGTRSSPAFGVGWGGAITLNLMLRCKIFFILLSCVSMSNRRWFLKKSDCFFLFLWNNEKSLKLYILQKHDLEHGCS